MGITRITDEEAKHIKGKTDLDKQRQKTDEELREAAMKDPENPLITEEDLKHFTRGPRRGKNS